MCILAADHSTQSQAFAASQPGNRCKQLAACNECLTLALKVGNIHSWKHTYIMHLDEQY